MSHSTVTVVIRDADTAEEAMEQLTGLLDPFDENKEIDPYPEWLDADDVEVAVRLYREHPEQCPGEDALGPVAPFDVYVTEGNLEAWNEWTRQAVGSYSRSDPEAGLYDPEGDRFGYYSAYNPDSRWDWWELGGRWHGFYQLKPKVRPGGVPIPEWRRRMNEQMPVGKDRVFGEETIETYDGSQDAVLGNGGTFGDDATENFEGRADLARKDHIDWESMRALAGQRADAAYDAFEKTVVGLDLPESWPDTLARVHFDRDEDPDETYDGYLLKMGSYDPPIPPATQEAWQDKRREIVNEARRQYHEQPWITALQEASLMPFLGDPLEEWCVHSGGREAFVRHARDGAGLTHAVLMDGRWYEQGRMGWFGMVTDEKDQTTWEREFARLVDRLPDECYLAVVDVHI